MAVCKIISPHLALEAATTIEASTFTDAAKPAAKLLTPNLFDTAKSGGATGQWVTFDLGSALDVEGVAVLGHTIPSSPTALRFAGNDTNVFTSPATGWIDLTWDADKIIEFFGTTYTYRYWRLYVSASAVFEIGSIVFGSVWTAPHSGYDGLKRRIRTSRDGTVTFDAVAFAFDNLTQAQSSSLRTIAERHLQRKQPGPYHLGGKPTLVCLDSGDEIVSPGGLQSWSYYARPK